MKLQAWVAQTAENLGMRPCALRMRLHRGTVPWPRIARKNKRVFHVLDAPWSQAPAGAYHRGKPWQSPTLPAPVSISKTYLPEGTA